MTNYALIAIYMVSILSVFIVPLYINLQRGRILLLSFLPILLIASSASVIMLISYFWDSKSFSESIGFAIYIFLLKVNSLFFIYQTNTTKNYSDKNQLSKSNIFSIKSAEKNCNNRNNISYRCCKKRRRMFNQVIKNNIGNYRT